MIDIHCHILPNVDDGAGRLEDSLEMARAAVNEGINTIVATPHHQNGRYNNPKSVVTKEVETLNGELQKAGIPLTVLPGQEVRVYGELIEDLQNGEIVPVGQYILVEFPANHIPSFAEQLLFDIQTKGYVPIIVHPERNQVFIEQPDRLYKLVMNGACTQITASSVIGRFGKNIQKFCKQLIESNLTHLIASDAHNTTSRGFYLKDAYNYIDRQFGMDYVYMFRENAQQLIDGNHLHKEIPERIKRKKFLGLF
ncbi:tyrosine-protein phosphatase [Aeribacillus pallidus]|uniref:tyrosine-protein phosphatase n=1 Tax=Aeribacillus pallidus TaxID=33936 RepID=UPI003D23E466